MYNSRNTISSLCLFQPESNFVILNREDEMDIIRLLCAIFLPPLGVFLQVGLGIDFWINVLLTLLGYVPGIIHAVWVILSKK
jgi:uncharacterized membrane protein YqaE (UPF0057 family)